MAISLSQHLSYKNFLLIGIPLALTIGGLLLIDTTILRNIVEEAGMWAPSVFVCLKILTIVVAPLSGGILYLSAGALFGFWHGIMLVVLGDIIGYTIAFYISRIFGRKAVEYILSKHESSFISRIILKLGTTKGFLIACLTFFWVPELLAYTAGLARISYPKFIIIIMCMLLPGSIFIVYVSTQF